MRLVIHKLFCTVLHSPKKKKKLRNREDIISVGFRSVCKTMLNNLCATSLTLILIDKC